MLDKTIEYQTRSFGKLRVVNIINYRKVEVEFVDTGYRVTTKTQSILAGSVKDKLKPTSFGVGFIGDGPYKSRSGKGFSKQYQSWQSMLHRCYCPIYQKRAPTYKGCSVDKGWHDFQSFAKWFDENHIKGYQLDKDIKIKGNKIYSPKTCCFVSPQKNTEASCAKTYRLTNPKGVIVDIFNMRKFCEKEGLTRVSLMRVYNGKKLEYKGWMAAPDCTVK